MPWSAGLAFQCFLPIQIKPFSHRNWDFRSERSTTVSNWSEWEWTESTCHCQ